MRVSCNYRAGIGWRGCSKETSRRVEVRYDFGHTRPSGVMHTCEPHAHEVIVAAIQNGCTYAAQTELVTPFRR